VTDRTRKPKGESLASKRQALIERAEALIDNEAVAEALAALWQRQPAALESEPKGKIRELTTDGLSAEAIAERLGLSIHYVRQIRSHTGILDQRRQEKAKRTRVLIRQLSADGIRVAEIARRLKLSRPYVSQVRMELGLAPTRKRKP
jgi:DNA-binding CsgD family transcriptional regulator